MYGQAYGQRWYKAELTWNVRPPMSCGVPDIQQQSRKPRPVLPNVPTRARSIHTSSTVAAALLALTAGGSHTMSDRSVLHDSREGGSASTSGGNPSVIHVNPVTQLSCPAKTLSGATNSLGQPASGQGGGGKLSCCCYLSGRYMNRDLTR